MNVTLRTSKSDSGMIEVLTDNPRGGEYLWAVVHSDFVCGEGDDIRTALFDGDDVVVTMELSK